ncbi:uncharacterized protein LOC112564896 [Pomacea canaliculata]|uniref:uncharacterized protein LOC112564896 n=1 Tax=Pomacea canaliculata TaxID=400727 RepID=UPI000D728F69|nr:uncharacterized protein LOC112564896 [Pomacea canaliculata]
MGISLNALPAEIRTVSTLRQLDVVLPAIISAFSARSLKLRFNLKGFEARLKSRNAVSFVLTMRTSCSFGSSTVDMQVRDLDTDDVVVRKMGTILYDDPTLSSSLALVIPASVLTMEIQLNFSAASHSFILDALVFEVEYDESAVGQDKVPIADSAAAYNGWLGKKDKRYFLTRTKDVQLEGINRPGTKAMTVKARRKAGNGIEIRASRLIFSGVNVESYVPRVIFDQTSRIFFFPQRDPSSQASFILGPRDPYAVDDVDSDLDEVEVDDQGDGNFTMNLTSTKYGQRSLVIGITSTTTTVLMSKMEDRFRDRLTSYIVCSFLLPCSEYGLSSQTFIRVDDSKEINAAGPWQMSRANQSKSHVFFQSSDPV